MSSIFKRDEMQPTSAGVPVVIVPDTNHAGKRLVETSKEKRTPPLRRRDRYIGMHVRCGSNNDRRSGDRRSGWRAPWRFLQRKRRTPRTYRIVRIFGNPGTRGNWSGQKAPLKVKDI